MGIEDITTRSGGQGRVVERIRRVDPALVAALQGATAAAVADCVGKANVLDPAVIGLVPGTRVCGPALTVLGADIIVRCMAVDLAEPGDVLVVAAGGVTQYACFGGHTAAVMAAKGMTGAVVDGAVRDVGQLRSLGFPTFGRGSTPRNFHYPVAAEFGGVNVPVVVAGAYVEPGDLVVGDEDGVIVVPARHAETVAERLVARALAEHEPLPDRYEPYGVADALRERGYIFGPDGDGRDAGRRT